MKLSQKEFDELLYLHNGGTTISELVRGRLVRKGLITSRGCFSNSPYNGTHSDLTSEGRSAILGLIYSHAEMWL